MANDGRTLGSPSPVGPIWRPAARADLVELLAGCNLYSMGAGGFSTVPAIPQMVRLRQPARPGREHDLTAASNYVTINYPARQPIGAGRFGVI